MIKVSILALAALLSIPSTAQAQYNFAGLSWDSSILEVEAKLQKQGFSGFGSLQKLKCKVQNSCSLDFTGPPITSGSAVFRNGLLTQVAVWPHNTGAAAEAIRRKYGASLPAASNSIFSLLEQK